MTCEYSWKKKKNSNRKKQAATEKFLILCKYIAKIVRGYPGSAISNFYDKESNFFSSVLPSVWGIKIDTMTDIYSYANP